MSTCYFTLVLATVLLAPPDTARKDSTPQRSIVTSDFQHAPDPEAGELMMMVGEDEQVGGNAAEVPCTPFGGWVEVFSGSNRGRGNVYRITGTTGNVEAELTEFQFEMQFTGTRTLYFSIFRQRFADPPETEFQRDQGLSTDVIVTATGSGSHIFYSTGILPTPVQLLGGYDYAIGVSWDASSTFARDLRSYPDAFGECCVPAQGCSIMLQSQCIQAQGVFQSQEGFVLGSWAINLSQTPPIDPNNDGIIINPANKAYSIKLCIAPDDGACCIPNSGCSFLPESDCLESGGFFEGEETSCIGRVCQFGACCGPCGDSDCSNDFPPEACANAAGVWHGPGVICQTGLCTKITGACCSETTCQELCEAECDDIGGAYEGDGTKCTPTNPCLGACCVPGGCADLSESTCQTFSGEYRGDRTACATLQGAQECGGACCFGFTPTFTGCSIVDQRSQCTFEAFEFTAYRGDMTTCPTFPSPGCGDLGDVDADGLGACCLSDGLCINTTEQFCGANWINGDFRKVGSQCGSNTCDTNACCKPDGSCAALTLNGCSQVGGELQGEALCVNADCGTPTGACCLPNGSCVAATTASACASNEGIYKGNNVGCDTAACEPFGPCCKPDGTCQEEVPDNTCINILNGTLGNSTNCALTSCPGSGACCDGFGGCAPGVLESQCESGGGTFQGEGSLCTPNPCGKATGACCLGFCFDTIQSNCEGQGGTFLESSLCSDTPPPCQLGACCTNETNCIEDQLQSTCDGPSRRWEALVRCVEMTPLCGGTTPLNIVGSEPPDNAIDARQPSSLDGTTLYGWDRIVLSFDGSAAGLTAADFSVASLCGVANAPTIIALNPAGNNVEVVFSGKIPTREWIRITHIPSGTSRRIGFLPGDVSGDLTTTASDILRLINHLNNVGTLLAIHQCDVDQSNACSGSDIIRLIDLLNGASTFDPWLGASLCP